MRYLTNSLREIKRRAILTEDVLGIDEGDVGGDCRSPITTMSHVLRVPLQKQDALHSVKVKLCNGSHSKSGCGTCEICEGFLRSDNLSEGQTVMPKVSIS